MHYFSNLGTFGNLMTPPPLFELFPTETWELFEFRLLFLIIFNVNFGNIFQNLYLKIIQNTQHLGAVHILHNRGRGVGGWWGKPNADIR